MSHTQIIWNARTQRRSSAVMVSVKNFRNQKLLTVDGIVGKKLIRRVIIIINYGDIWWCRGCMQETLPSSMINGHENSKRKKYNLQCQKCYDHCTRPATLLHLLTRQHNRPISPSICQHHCFPQHSAVKLYQFISFSVTTHQTSGKMHRQWQPINLHYNHKAIHHYHIRK